MKKLKPLFLLFFISLLVLQTSSGQPINNLTGKIIKEDLQVTPTELSLSDFSYQADSEIKSGIVHSIRSKPGLAMLSSAIIPGSAQAANGKWVRAGIYLAAEAFTVLYYIDRNNTAKRQERNYISYANSSWSVVAYAQWLVDYSQAHNLDNGYEALATNISGQTAEFNTSDWNKVDLTLLQSVEVKTPYFFPDRQSSNFSHVLPAYGSQQYYELISKYYQFMGGWSDFSSTTNQRYFWDGTDISFQFAMGRDRAAQFNDNYRLAGNIFNLILINHVVSAFDGYFSVKLKNSRIETQANLLRPDSFSVILHF